MIKFSQMCAKFIQFNRSKISNTLKGREAFFIKKWLLAAAICIFAAVFTAGCGKKDTPDMDTITYEKLYEANRGSRLLEKYNSVRYELFLSNGAYDSEGTELGKSETWTMFKQDEEYVIMKETDGKECIVYADGTCYYEYAANEKNRLHSQGWFMNDSYEKYMDSGIEGFLLEAESGEDFDSIEEEGDTYVLFAYVGDSDGEKYYYRYTVDKESLEIRKFEAVIVAENGDEWVVSHGGVVTDAAVELPAYVNEIKMAEKKRTVVIHTEENEDIEVKLPENVTLLVMLEEGCGLFADKEGEEKFDDTLTERNEAGVYPDAECYLLHEAE